MYGKHFEKMYTGSLMGAGARVFAVMGYVISHQKPPDFNVEINPKLVSVLIGEPEDEIQKAVEFLCAPDPNSRSEREEGRRLLKLGQFLYHVVNGESYHGIKSQEELRAYWREQKRKKSEPGQSEPETVVKTRFIKPTIEELRLHAAKIGLPESEAVKFFSHYESNGWKVGKNPMKSWQSSMSGWKVRWEEAGRPGKPTNTITHEDRAMQEILKIGAKYETPHKM